MLLPTKTVMKLGPELGVCIAISMRDETTVGCLYCSGRGQGPDGMKAPPADLVTDPTANPEFVNVTALTPDGTAFLDLVRPEAA